MNSTIIVILIGVVAGIIDIIPMFIKKLDRLFILSAFLFWCVNSFITSRVILIPNSTINGLCVTALLFLPLSFLIYRVDREAIIPVILTTTVLGLLVGFSMGYFL